MDIGSSLSVVQTILAALQCSELREFCSIWGYKSQLEDLQRTVNTVKAVLNDAQSKQVQPNMLSQAQLFIEELKDVVYNADDLLDEFVTLAEQKKLNKPGKFSQKLRPLFSRYNSLAVAYNMSRAVKEIRKRIDAIANNHSNFGFKFDGQPIRRRREDTCSYVYTQDIIGRDRDVELILDRLLDPDVQRDVSFLAIVGVGGLGKTALAQLVYNHPKVGEKFPLRLWTCVNDQETWDVKATICKILQAATEGDYKHLDLEPLQNKLRNLLAGKKYLIVLDDVWNEKRFEWNEWAKFLKDCQKGSWIIVTTRSEITAKIVGDEHPHMLEGLSEEDSSRLFGMAAFDNKDEQTYPSDLVTVGRAIVKRCAGVPLAIKVVGSLLYGQSKEMWLMFQEMGSEAIKGDKDDNSIMTVLKFSYHHLDPPLKACFSYCAVFPKDFVIYKEQLICLWMAQGYLIPNERLSVEDVGEGYFSVLVKRCFFQDVQKDECGEIFGCKIHDLMHDIAEEVAGKEVYRTDLCTRKLDNNKIRHLTDAGCVEGTDLSLTKGKIRTFLCVRHWARSINLEVELGNWVCLRTLGLRSSRIASLPSALGKLLHLRYLDLSWNQSLEMLPNSITKLHNLQTLILKGCRSLKELPRALGKLRHLRYLDLSGNQVLEVLPNSIGDLHNLQTLILEGCYSLKKLPRALGKLRHLRYLDLSANIALEVLPNSIGDLHNLRTLKLRGCRSLKELPEDFSNLVNLKVLDMDEYYHQFRRMPRGMEKLRHLEKLPWFVAGDRTSTLKENIVHQMEGLRALAGLRGRLEIRIYENTEYVVGNATEGGYLRNKEHLTDVEIFFPGSGGMGEDEQRLLLQHLRPHSNLRQLTLWCYRGTRPPSWDQEDNLATALPNLKVLQLYFLSELEYIEDRRGACIIRDNVSASLSQTFFPSLEILCLFDLPKLKSWWRDDELIDGDCNQARRLSISFPSLRKLSIQRCPHFTCALACPALEELELREINQRLRITIPTETGISKLRNLSTDNAGHLKCTAPIEAFQCLREMRIEDDSRIVNLSEMEEVFRSCSASLQKLLISNCSRLESVRGVLHHLTALEELSLYLLPNLNVGNTADREEEDGMPWRGLHHSLRSLHLDELPKMVNLPKGMRYLTSLRFLTIWDCKQLFSVPKWVTELTSLQTLGIRACSESLRQRCQKDTGQDWPNIQHIPHLFIA